MKAFSYLLAPSILSADFAMLGAEVSDVIKSGADLIHFDVMDNHYVPNLTIGPAVCESLIQYLARNNDVAPIDVHLMVEPVDSLIEAFGKLKVAQISFHPEASHHVNRSLQLIKALGIRAGLAINPGTSLDCLEYNLDYINYVLIMSVNPGFGGQAFIPETLDKIQKVRNLLIKKGKEQNIRIAVDGGVNSENIAQIAQAGADTFIVGSALFSQREAKTPHYDKIIGILRKKLNDEISA